MELELELNDTKPLFPIRKEDKAVIDKEMCRSVLLGILKKGLSSYSSPVMLIPRKSFKNCDRLQSLKQQNS